MGDPLKFLFVLIGILGFAWFVSNNNPSGGLSHINFGVIQTPYTPPKQLPTDAPGIGTELDKITAELERVKSEVAKAQSLGERSVYADTVSLNGSGNASSEDVTREYLTFTVSPRATGQIQITGWKLQSPITGASVSIPKGIYLPFSGQVVEPQSIFVSPGDRVTILTGRSPSGYSFRLNKCTGYFEQFQNFTPSLPTQCPRPNSEKLPQAPNNLNDKCLDFLDQIPQCTVPTNIPPGLSPECETYISQKINYGTCVQIHKNDKDFYTNEWRIYLARDQELWKDRREVIKLIDLKGKTVDTVSY